MIRRIAAAALLFAAVPALADRGPSQGEATAIAASLNAAGYTSWKRIRFDDKVWKIVDARTVKGKTHDLELSPTDYGIVKQD